MPLFSKPELSISAKKTLSFSKKSAAEILKSASAAEDDRIYDIFLSHRYLDAKYILGLKVELENLSYSVFVDWIEKPALNRANVVVSTAAWLRKTMGKCKCLLYAISNNSPDSKWMPWELGYSDGIHGKVAIIPILDSRSLSEDYSGMEFLGLYPYVTKSKIRNSENYGIWINNSPTVYIGMNSWLNGKSPHAHN